MTEGRYGYCSIYVKAPDAVAVTELLEGVLKTPSDNDNIRLAGVEMDARTNPDVADVSAAEDDFVRWPVLIEVDGDDPDNGDAMVPIITSVITALWEAGHPAVAACDFEEELPWNGGIQRIARTT